MKHGWILATACAAILLSFLISRGVEASLGAILLGSLIFAYVILACGRVFLRLFNLAFPLPACWAIGVSVSGPVLWGIVAVLGCSAGTAFVLWAVIVVVSELGLNRLRPDTSAAAAAPADLIGFLFCCALTGAWCKDIAAAPKVLEASGQLQPWVEYFIHAGVIAQFGDEHAIGRGLVWLSDTPLFAYHYSSYVLAAVFGLPLDTTGLALATSVWLPVGFLSAASAAYTLGACFAGAAGGLAALLALLVIPDASNYGLRNGFFSFHWLMLAVPGSAYGLGSALLAVAVLQRWALERRTSLLVAGALLLATTLLIRIQVFVLLAPAWIGAAALVARVWERHRKLVLASGLLFAAATLVLALHPPSLPAVAWSFDSGRALERFLYQVHTRQEPTAYEGLYRQVLSEFGESVGFTFGTLLVYPACLGAFLLTLPLMYVLRRRAADSFSNMFPAVLLVWYGAVMVLAPIPAHLDATDYPHRSFVLLYGIAAIWTAGLAVRWLSDRGTHGTRLWQLTAVAAAIGLPVAWMDASERAHPKFQWARSWIGFKVHPELLEASAVLRKRANPGDIFVARVREFAVTSIDAPTVVIALTGVPTYVARIGVHRIFGGVHREVSLKRFTEVSALERAPDRETAMNNLASLGIRWYLATEPGSPSWDRGRKAAAWTGGTYALYDSAGVSKATR